MAHHTSKIRACLACLAMSAGILIQRTECDIGSQVEVHTPYESGVGSGWFYYVAEGHNGSYASDYRQHCIRRYESATGSWQAWAGVCQVTSAGFKNAKRNRAKFDQPHGICITPRSEVIVADTGNHCVRVITQEGVVGTLAGSCGHPGDVDGSASEALFSDVLDVQCLSNCSVLVTEPGAGRIRLINDTSNTCPASKPTGQHSGMHWGWLLHWYPLAVMAFVAVAVAAHWCDARFAKLQPKLQRLLTGPAATQEADASGADTQQHASLARLRLARIFSSRRTSMRRTQYDSVAADLGNPSLHNRAARAAQATRDAAALLQSKRDNYSISTDRQRIQSPCEQHHRDPHGQNSQLPEGSADQNGSTHTSALQHCEPGHTNQVVDPNMDVFQLFESATPASPGNVSEHVCDHNQVQPGSSTVNERLEL